MTLFERSGTSLLTCPACDHKQEEARSALSTFCRGCGRHYKIAAGAAIPAAPPPPFPFPMRKDRAHRVGPGPNDSARADRSGNKASSLREAQLELFAGLDRNRQSSATPAAPPMPAVATSSGDHPALARMARRLQDVPKTGHRHIHCLECDFPQSIPVGALSTMCLRCTAPIPLGDYAIGSMHHRRIRTRGNVHIHRKGGVIGVAVQCNNLTIEGEFTGSGIDCDGDLTLTHDGVFTGPVRCRRLLVQDRAEVTFTHPVHAQEVFIDGAVRGNLICERKLHLDRKSLLEGDIQTRSLSVSEGARHTGMVSMPQLEERYAKFGDPGEAAGPASPKPEPTARPSAPVEATRGATSTEAA